MDIPLKNPYIYNILGNITMKININKLDAIYNYLDKHLLSIGDTQLKLSSNDYWTMSDKDREKPSNLEKEGLPDPSLYKGSLREDWKLLNKAFTENNITVDDIERFANIILSVKNQIF